jgi:hypothetical protein
VESAGGEGSDRLPTSPVSFGQTPLSPQHSGAPLPSGPRHVPDDEVLEGPRDQAEEEQGEEDKELARRQALAARMAAMGGVKIGEYYIKTKPK